MSAGTERRSYRADTLEEALRLVSDELGPDALVVRQREGVIGGVGGFFGRHCVELEVELPAGPAAPSEPMFPESLPRPRSLAIPRSAVIDLYDSAPTADPLQPVETTVREPVFVPFVPDGAAVPAGADWVDPQATSHSTEPEPAFDWLEPQAPARTVAQERPAAADAPEAPVAPDEPTLVAEPERPARPTLPEPATVAPETPAVAAEPAEPAVAATPTVDAAPETPVVAAAHEAPADTLAVEEIAPEPSASIDEPDDAGPLVRTLFDQAAPFADKLSETLERTSIGRRLADAGMNSRVAREVVLEAETELRAFNPLQPFEEQVRTALARRIKVSRMARRKRRVIALVGPPGAGKTLTAARLCHVYGGDARRPVAALSLQPVREAFRLAEQMRSLDVQLAAADEARVLEVELEKLDQAELLIVDTPGVEAGDDERLHALAALLELVGADETHLLVPAALDAPRVRELVEAFSSTLGANRLMITHLDGAGGATAAVSASIDSRLPISFTATGASWGLRPADPHHLAELVVR